MHKIFKLLILTKIKIELQYSSAIRNQGLADLNEPAIYTWQIYAFESIITIATLFCILLIIEFYYISIIELLDTVFDIISKKIDIINYLSFLVNDLKIIFFTFVSNFEAIYWENKERIFKDHKFICKLWFFYILNIINLIKI